MGTKLGLFFNKMECVLFSYVFLLYFIYICLYWFDDDGDGQVEI